MSAKLDAATVAVNAGCDMIIANGKDVGVIHKIMEGRRYGTLFVGNRDENFDIADYVVRRK